MTNLFKPGSAGEALLGGKSLTTRKAPTAKQARHSQFQKGQGAFQCRVCLHTTRNTGDNGAVHLCPICYDLAGEDNHLSDTGEVNVAAVMGLLNALNAQCGDGAAGQHFPELLAACAKAAAPAVTPVETVDAAKVAALGSIELEATVEFPTTAPAVYYVASDGEKTFHQYLPAPEAAKRIRTLGRKRTVFLHVEQEGRTNAKKFFPIMGNVRVSRAQAMKFVEDAYKNFTERGALVHLVWAESCLFVG